MQTAAEFLWNVNNMIVMQILYLVLIGVCNKMLGEAYETLSTYI
jgi:hypothetical protein